MMRKSKYSQWRSCFVGSCELWINQLSTRLHIFNTWMIFDKLFCTFTSVKPIPIVLFNMDFLHQSLNEWWVLLQVEHPAKAMHFQKMHVQEICMHFLAWCRWPRRYVSSERWVYLGTSLWNFSRAFRRVKDRRRVRR